MRAEPQGVDFVLGLVPDPSVDHVGREDVAAEQVVVVLAQGGQGLVERAGRRGDVLQLFRRQVIDVLSNGSPGSILFWMPSMTAISMAENVR